MGESSFKLRPMEWRDIGGALKLSQAEGWNQTENDWKLLVEKPDTTCLLVEQDSKVIGTTTAINYSNQIAWVGMVLVDRAHRGQGVSTLLLHEILKRTGPNQSIKLDATTAGQKVYKKFGFKEEYSIARMVNPSWDNRPHREHINLPQPIQLEHIREISAFDETVFGVPRFWLIEKSVQQFPARAWMIKSSGQLNGFVLGRAGSLFHQIGPLAANNFIDAQCLISKALMELNHQPIVVDVPCHHAGLIQWLISIGFSEQRNFVRMYKNQNPFPGKTEKQFLICGPEFG